MTNLEKINATMTYDEGELSEEALGSVTGGGAVGGVIGAAIGNGLFYSAGYAGARKAGWSKKKSKEYAKSCGYFGATFGTALGGLFIPV